MALCIPQFSIVFLLTLPFALFPADKEQHYFEQYKPGFYVNMIAATVDSIFVSPDVFHPLPFDVTKQILIQGIKPKDLFALRCVNQSFSKNILFYIDILSDGDFRTDKSVSLLSWHRGGFKELRDHPNTYKMQVCLEMAKRGSFFVNSLHIEFGSNEWGKNILEALIENKAPMIKPYGQIICKKGDIAWLEGKLPHNDYTQRVWIQVDEMSESDERALGKIVKKCTNLKTFFIHHCSYLGGKPKAQVSDLGARAIAKYVARHKKIRWLEIVDSNVGDIGAYALAAALKKNDSLSILSLGSNRIGREGMEALIAAGEKHKNLKDLAMELNLPPDSKELVSAYRTFKLKDGERGKNWVSWQ